ncbi:DNA replication licensing factor mcm5 [Fusarium oxysporum f. sp. rapae]|uniref:DNA helicase n=1 Tax=Fusarium oxysporum f. sp. rapae TaxID=485398 RepID=A0A8J5PL61_FUSOX|nr:DNA replication licensing factor mcm5 [Fusarium oxysporum f. sp. rapae]
MSGPADVPQFVPNLASKITSQWTADRSNSAHIYEPNFGEHRDTRLQLQTQLETFILDFWLDNNFVYRDQLRENALLKRYYCDVNINDLIRFNEGLAHQLVSEPAEVIPFFENALMKCTHRIVFPHEPKVDIPKHQLLLHSNADDVSIRNLDSMAIDRLVRVPGIVIGAYAMSSKATELHTQCQNCGHTNAIPILGGLTGVTLPRKCARSRIPNDPTPGRPLHPYYVVHEKSHFVDQQIVKLQETPDQVPVGELPRHVFVSADRCLINRVVPGSRCTVMSIFSIYQNKTSKNSSNGGAVAIRTPYLRAVGIRGGSARILGAEQTVRHLQRHGCLYRSFNLRTPGHQEVNSLPPVRWLKKFFPDGMRLRGDINVLLLGGPGTAKSRLLKFVQKAAPISIYTSGKGSSAAGLTASVQRDQSTREFYLEDGAMVVADGGVVCIDEFDKMRAEDRVAIHEAMEQQTISIAKAGIITILKARTSVLAAAKPIFGRYDDMKTPGENIDFQTTILSRFDIVFIIKDDYSREKDKKMAKHVLGIQMNDQGAAEMVESKIPIDKIQRYITYCKTRCAPQLSPEAAEKLSSHFVSIRRQIHDAEIEANTRSSIPITIRQLETIVSITESLAKLTLSPVATEAHVDEAIRLFL